MIITGENSVAITLPSYVRDAAIGCAMKSRGLFFSNNTRNRVFVQSTLKRFANTREQRVAQKQQRVGGAREGGLEITFIAT